MLVRMDDPSPLVHTTLSPPISEQIAIWQLHQPFPLRFGQSELTYVYEHVLLAVPRRGPENEPRADDDHDARVGQEPRRHEERLERWDRRCCLLARAVHRNHNGANHTERTANLAEEGQSLFKEDGGEDCAVRRPTRKRE